MTILRFKAAKGHDLRNDPAVQKLMAGRKKPKGKKK